MRAVTIDRARPSAVRSLTPGSLAAAVTAFVALGAAIGVPAVSVTYWLSRGSSSALWSEVGSAATSTLGIAVLGALATTLVALPVAILGSRYSQHRVARVIERTSYLGHALPGVVIALSLVFFGIRVAPALYQRTPLLVVAYVVLFLPLSVAATTTSIAQASPALEAVARCLGETAFGAFRRVTLPLAAPGIGAGVALVALACVKELPATLLLRPTGVETLATQLWSETSTASYAAAAPYAALLIAVAAIPTFILTRKSGVMDKDPR